jgi:DNA-binding XRE family transcriptional regulator/quercetin dioxygenase-like cupin family protein
VHIEGSERLATVRTPRNGKLDYPEMGDSLREARRGRGLSLRELADRLGVSPSLISQIETGRANPSVSTLYAIAAELDVSLDELLFDDRRPGDAGAASGRVGGAAATGGAPAVAVPGGIMQPSPPVQRAATRHEIRLASGVVWDRLTTTSEPGIEFLHVTYEVGGASGANDVFQRHPGHEWGYVLSGTLEVRIGFDEYVLEPGDAISINSSVPHRLANIGDVPVTAIWFVLGRAQFDAQTLIDEHRPRSATARHG